MRTVHVPVRNAPYDVVIGRFDRDTLREKLRHGAGRTLVIADRHVHSLHRQTLEDALPHGTPVVGFPSGETSKSLQQAERMYAALADAVIGRDGRVITFGGGVAGDLGGFVAATWMRGIEVMHCATTLEAAIDASIGGKTAVNHFSGKNLIGVFHQPCAVIIDLAWLDTLPQRDWSAGLAESVKHALIADAGFLDWHERTAERLLSRDDDEVIEELIATNCGIKAAVVAADERESGPRMALNYGHTAGHAIELLCDYGLRHGECVALGMRVAHQLAMARGMLAAEEGERLSRLLTALRLPTRLSASQALDPGAAWRVCGTDKKNRGGAVRFVLLQGVGSVTLVDDVSEAEFRAAWEAIAGDAPA